MDRGAATDAGFVPALAQQLHLHNPITSRLGAEGLEAVLCKMLRPLAESATTSPRPWQLRQQIADPGTRFATIQGPGWSSEYIGGRHQGRADYRRVLHGFLHHVLPRPGRWETKTSVDAFQRQLEQRIEFSRENCERFQRQAPWHMTFWVGRVALRRLIFAPATLVPWIVAVAVATVALWLWCRRVWSRLFRSAATVVVRRD